MNVNSLLISVFISLCYSKPIVEDSELGQVVFVSALFRHGDRTPHTFYQTDPYNDIRYWPEGVGQLTNIGKQQEFALGLWLRARYDALLTEAYHPDHVYAQSTDVDRTLMSAQCVLAGMFPPKGVQVWNDQLLWQPIPVHTIPAKLDNVFSAYAPCPAYKEEYEEVLKSKEIEEINEKYANIYEVLNANTGERKFDLEYIFKIYSVLFVENLKNLTLPEWTKSIFPEPVTEAASYSFTLETRNKKLARFKAGLMIKSMTDDMKAKVEGNSRNIHIYSAHETTVATLLNGLGVFQLHNPPYSACVVVELRVLPSGNHVVTIFYRKPSVAEPQLLTIPGCTPACPLDQFISLTDHLAISPEEWSKECQCTKEKPCETTNY